MRIFRPDKCRDAGRRIGASVPTTPKELELELVARKGDIGASVPTTAGGVPPQLPVSRQPSCATVTLIIQEVIHQLQLQNHQRQQMQASQS